MSNRILYQMLLALPLISNCFTVNLKDVTQTFFGKNTEGVIGAFGDFNADKHIDIFVINEDNTVDVLLAPEQAPYLQYNQPYIRRRLLAAANDTITSLVPGDYDGDAQMDLLVTRRAADHKVKVHIYYGQTKTVTVGEPTNVTDNMLDEPLVFDYNADMIPDLLGQTQPDQLSVWIGNKTRDNFTEMTFSPRSSPPLRIPHSNAFLDLDNNFNSDLMLTTGNKSELWTFWEGEWVSNKSLDGVGSHILGQSVFADFDANSEPDQVMPVCEDAECKQSSILINSPAGMSAQWHNLTLNFVQGGVQWGFVPPPPAEHTEGPLDNLPITLRVGDFNLDGFPDLVAVLRSQNAEAKDVKQEAYVLENVECKEKECNNPSGRTFRVDWENPITATTGGRIMMAAIFDLGDNGILDLLVVETVAGKNRIRALQNQFDSDACFIKVMVVSGLCSSNCPNNQPPYGVNQPGPSIKYQTVATDGSMQQSCASQLSQSAHFALQLPYVVFGLGMSPNFVDKLTVGIPTHGDTRVKSWTQTIPNSQLIIIPYPINQPSSWKNKLFVTPSRLVLLTAAALVGTCGFIAGLVGVLHWRKKKKVPTATLR